MNLQTQKRAKKKAAAKVQTAGAPQKKPIKQAVKKAGTEHSPPRKPSLPRQRTNSYCCHHSAGVKLTDAFKAQDWKAAVAALEAMRADGLPPTTVHCNKVLSCLCKHGEIDRAALLLSQMHGSFTDPVRPLSPTSCQTARFPWRF